MQISRVFGTRLSVHCQRVFRNKTSYPFKSTHILESKTSEILHLWGSLFFSEHWKFNVDSENPKKKNAEKIYGFSDNLILIGNGKFSLWLREYS